MARNDIPTKLLESMRRRLDGLPALANPRQHVQDFDIDALYPGAVYALGKGHYEHIARELSAHRDVVLMGLNVSHEHRDGKHYFVLAPKTRTVNLPA